MALSMIENVYAQSRNTTREEIDKICTGILDNLYVPEKSGECMNCLRQLYFILQTSQTEPWLSKKMVTTVVNMVSSMDKEKTKECLLCQHIIAEMLPRDRDDLGSDFYVDDTRLDPVTVTNCFPLHIVQGDKYKCFAQLLSQAIKWISSNETDYNVQMKCMSFLIAVSLLHSDLLKEDMMKSVNFKLCDWLMNAGLHQAANPYTKNPFKKDHSNMVNEIDGTQSRNFFTVLNIGQYYTDDQLLNIYSFSMLYRWLYQSHNSLALNNQSPEGATNQFDLTKVFNALVGKTIDYCFRILDQCERKPKVPSDTELQNCCLLETVTILDIICKIDPGHVAKVFQEVRRLYSRLSQDLTKTRLLLPILQFFVNHSKVVVHDPQEAYSMFFHKLLSRGFTDPAVAFDVVMFIRDNLEFLCHHSNVLSTYFPNILKILAWNPRAYITEFTDILPALMTPTTAVEVFHALLDLPCMTASLEIVERSKKNDPTSVTMTTAKETEAPSNSIEAFNHPFYRPMFNFFTRVEGGHGDTINRLSSFHDILGDMSQHPRVIVCSQVVPVLLRIWFDTVLEGSSSDFISRLLPVLLERSALLYTIPAFKVDIKRVISESLVLLIRSNPRILIDQPSEILDFLISPRNIADREDFFSNLIWGVGEYCSASHDDRCNAEMIGRFFEVLEALTYELSGLVSIATDINTIRHAKIISMLMSSISKLASRRQDLIPRAILCFNKVAKQQQGGYLDVEIQDALVSRAQELTNLLKLPNFASVVLNPSSEIYTGRWHQDSTCLPAILRGVNRIVSNDSHYKHLQASE